MVSIDESLGLIGEYVSIATQKSIAFIASLGVNLTLLQAKILNLIIISILIYVIVKLITFTKPLWKYFTLGLLGILIVSIVVSII